MRNLPVVLLLCLLSSLPLALRGQENRLEVLSTEAYLSLMDADALVAEGKSTEALDLYRKALQGYEEILRTDATFKTRVVEYRLEYLRAKVAELSPKTDAPEEKAPPVTVAPPEEDFRGLYLELREKMARDATRLLELEKRGIEMAVVLREREEALQTLRTESQRIRRELESARAEGSRLNAQLQKEVQDLSRFNSLLQERADKQDVDLKQLTQDRDRLTAEQNQTRAELADWKEKAERAAEQLNTVRTLSNENAARFEKIEQELETALAAALAARDAALQQVALNESKLREIPALQEGMAQLKTQMEAQTLRAAELEQRTQEAEKKAVEFQTALAEGEKGFSERAASLKNELSEVQTRAADLQASYDAARESLASESELRRREQETSAKQVRVYADTLNEITLLRQMLTDRDNRLKDQKSRHDQELAELRRQLESPATPATPPEAPGNP